MSRTSVFRCDKCGGNCGIPVDTLPDNNPIAGVDTLQLRYDHNPLHDDLPMEFCSMCAEQLMVLVRKFAHG